MKTERMENFVKVGGGGKTKRILKRATYFIKTNVLPTSVPCIFVGVPNAPGLGKKINFDIFIQGE